MGQKQAPHHPAGRRVVRVELLKNQAVITDKCIVAECFLDRLRGLIAKPGGLKPGEGMLFPKCNDIHMWFMTFPIDVVFIKPDKNAGSDRSIWRVTSVRENVRPWRLLPVIDLRASDTIELPAGVIKQYGISVGDELCIS